jgi:hypothetical protein
MPTTRYFPCPLCGIDVEVDPEIGLRLVLCSHCGRPVEVPADDPQQRSADQPPVEPSPWKYSAVELPPEDVAPRLEVTPAWREVRLKRGPGESLAVLALLLPLLAACLTFFGNPQEAPLVAVAMGTAFLTAALLALDAHYLGSADLEGRRRQPPMHLFIWIFFIWIIAYPMAYFRRTRFGRPNYGLAALLVAVVFAAGPLLKLAGADLSRLLSGEPPPCGSPEVTRAVEATWRKNASAPKLNVSRNHKETSYDRTARVRTCQCVLETDWGEVQLTYTVSLHSSLQRTFEVRLQEEAFNDPPLCTCPEVTAMVEEMLKEAPNPAFKVRGAEAFEETRYDKDTRTRFGACKVRTDTGVHPVVFKVKLTNPTTGAFQVQILP